MRGRRLRYVPLIAAALLVTAPLVGGISFTDEYHGLCVNESTQLRVHPNACGSPDSQGHTTATGHYYRWIDTNSTVPVPALGQHVPVYIGLRTLPSGDIAVKVPEGCSPCH